MVRLDADENFPLPIVEFLRLAGHDVHPAIAILFLDGSQSLST